MRPARTILIMQLSNSRGCEITLDDNTICHLSPGTWNKVVREGMRRCGYLKNQKIAKIKVEK